MKNMQTTTLIKIHVAHQNEVNIDFSILKT